MKSRWRFQIYYVRREVDGRMQVVKRGRWVYEPDN